MIHSLFGASTCKASIAILIKETGFNSAQIQKAYITPIGANTEAFIAMGLWYQENGKAPAGLAKTHLNEVLFELDRLGVDTILIADSTYFKFLTKESKIDAHHGYVLNSQIKGYENRFKVILIPNYRAITQNPKIQDKINIGLTTLKQHILGTWQEPGKDIIHSAQYPETLEEIELALMFLQQYPELVIDIETKGLEFWNCGLASIAFSWSKHDFIAFPIDRGTLAPKSIKLLLKAFLVAYSDIGKLTGHNLGFDWKILVYELWMKDLQDYPGMIEGIKVLTRNFDDTKLISYLATNNAVENILKLKVLSAEFTGNYAEDVTDTSLLHLPDLLEYNGIDCLATWYVKEKYEPIMDQDDQRDIYETIFKPSVRTLLQTELCGMPIVPEKVQEAKVKLTSLVNGYRQVLNDSHIVQEFHLGQQELKCQEFTDKAKVKVFTLDDPRVVAYTFNPNSGPQLQALLFKYIGLPILDYTDTKQAATGGKTLSKLLNHTEDQEVIDILTALIGLSTADKILTSFIPAFENAQQLPDGSWRLYGNFNLGSVKTGRLASNSPNLMNLPSHSVFAKLIKECFACIPGWVFVGDDSDALEDKISALTTKDKNKLKVYTDGFCGHCLRAYFYYNKDMVGIDPTDPKSINSIEHKYPEFRQTGKTKTFLLTYGGSYHGLMKNEGLLEDEAKHIENQYHTLYSESDEWVAAHIAQARIDGYVIGAFGLRLRTPLLAKSGKGKLTYKTAAESRTAGNMLGQSYCQLTMRAFNEFLERVWASPYKFDILPSATIHDAIYLIVRDRLGIVAWVNKNLVECMAWQDLPELQHDIVKISSSMEIFYPHWGKVIKIPNNASMGEIKTICHKAEKGFNNERIKKYCK